MWPGENFLGLRGNPRPGDERIPGSLCTVLLYVRTMTSEVEKTQVE